MCGEPRSYLITNLDDTGELNYSDFPQDVSKEINFPLRHQGFTPVACKVPLSFLLKDIVLDHLCFVFHSNKYLLKAIFIYLFTVLYSRYFIVLTYHNMLKKWYIVKYAHLQNATELQISVLYWTAITNNSEIPKGTT